MSKRNLTTTSRLAKRPPKPSRSSAPAKPVSTRGLADKAAGKIGVLVDLLSKPNGAPIEALTKKTGWQAHSVRGAISGVVKRKLALTVESKRIDGKRVYRIVGR